MHYCILLFTKEFPTDEVIGDRMKPYRYDNCFDEEGKRKKFPTFTWDYWLIGGRYNGLLKLAVREKDETYQWDCYVHPERNGRLFRSFLLDTVSEYAEKASVMFTRSEEYFFNTMGRPDGYIRVDGAAVDDILNRDELECFGFIDKDGNASSRETWDGVSWIKNEQFDEQFRNAISDSSGCFVCVLDVHD